MFLCFATCKNANDTESNKQLAAIQGRRQKRETKTRSQRISVLCTHTQETHVQRQRQPSFVRAYFSSRFPRVAMRFRPFSTLACYHLPAPAVVTTRAVLKLRRRHRRHFRVSILFLPLPPLIVWAVRGRVYVYALLYPVHGCQQILGPRRLALSRARHAMRLLGDSVQVQPH